MQKGSERWLFPILSRDYVSRQILFPVQYLTPWYLFFHDLFPGRNIFKFKSQNMSQVNKNKEIKLNAYKKYTD